MTSEALEKILQNSEIYQSGDPYDLQAHFAQPLFGPVTVQHVHEIRAENEQLRAKNAEFEERVGKQEEDINRLREELTKHASAAREIAGVLANLNTLN